MPRSRYALVLGRFHAVTRTQAAWLASLGSAPVDTVIGVITSANSASTRRNPLTLPERLELLRPALERAGRPFELVEIDDIPSSEQWVEHVLREVERATAHRLGPENTVVCSSNRDVRALFIARGFSVESQAVEGPTPHELVQAFVDGKAWRSEASPETQRLFDRPQIAARLKDIFRQTLLTDDGELGHHRDFASYGSMMDASLRQKLDDLLPFVKPGCIVDKGCGTGKLLVELSKLYPSSQLVGVDLSRELLRVCDENTYASEDVSLISGNVIERSVPVGSASTVIFSSVMHEVHSYSGYRVEEIDRALRNTALELEPGGRVLIRDGVSPEPDTWRLKLLTPQTQQTFARFAAEFRHGQGVRFEALGADLVQLSAHDANEFLCKKDYLTNWHIEVHEEFGPLTLKGWREALERCGFETLVARGTVNPWIVEHRYQGTVELTDVHGSPLPWPATNCVVVGQKR